MKTLLDPEAFSHPESFEELVASLKDVVFQDNLLRNMEYTGTGEAFSFEDNARIVGSLLAHRSWETHAMPFSGHVDFKDDKARIIGYQNIDHKFSTDQTLLYLDEAHSHISIEAQAHALRGKEAFGRVIVNRRFMTCDTRLHGFFSYSTEEGISSMDSRGRH